jgi:RNA-directed DNA polymerase
MMPSCTAGAWEKPSACARRLPSDWRSVDWRSTFRKRRSFIARIATAKGITSRRSFTFLGYEFRPRRARNYRGKYFVSFLPAISSKAVKTIRQEIRGWALARRSDKTILDLARMFNPKIQVWVQYYGKYYRSMLHPVFRPLDRILVRWACQKYKKLRGHRRRAAHWLKRISIRAPKMWAHWAVGVKVTVN